MRFKHSAFKAAAFSLAAALTVNFTFMPPTVELLKSVAAEITYTDDDGNVYTIEKIDGLQFHVYEDHAVVSLCDGGVKSAAIPEEAGGQPVTKIEQAAFGLDPDLESISIPDTVVQIEKDAFKGTKLLSSQTGVIYADNWVIGFTGGESTSIKQGITDIADYAFYRGSMSSLQMADSIRTIGKYAFAESKLSSIVMPDSLVEIHDYAFSNCRSLVKVKLNKGIKTIGSGVFSDDSKLGSINLPDSITKLGSWAFADCNSLTEIHIPNTLKTIDECTFYYCRGLTEITIPNSVKTIKSGAFAETSIKNFVIPASVTSIEKAYYSSGGYTYSTIGNYRSGNDPVSVTIYNPNCVIGESAIRSIAMFGYASSTSEKYKGKDNMGFVSMGDIFDPEAVFTDDQGEYTMGVYDNLYYRMYADHVEINACDDKAISIEIPSQIDAVPVTAIGNYAFCHAKDLESVSIPSSVIRIGKDAFLSTKLYREQEEVKYADNWAVGVDKSVTSVMIPSGTVGIADYCFYESNVTACKLPDSLLHIGKYSFSNSKIERIIIPKNVSALGDYAFSGCRSLVKVTLPEGIKIIGSGAFSDDSKLGSINLPDSITKIGEWAFADCNSLTEIHIPTSLKVIDKCTFYYCRGLTEITIPNSVMTIKSGAFSETSIKNFVIPASVTSIEKAYYSSGGYTYSTIGNYRSGNDPNTIVIYNPNCVIGESAIRCETLYGHKNSTAEKYTSGVGKFVSLGAYEEHPETSMPGDCNLDGELSAADLVMLQRYIMNAGKITYANNVDLCADGVIDVYDLVLLRKLVIESKS